MLGSQLLSALSYHRNQRLNELTISNTFNLPITEERSGYSGKEIAKLFANEASSTLTESEYNLLLVFLKTSPNTVRVREDTRRNLKERVGQLLDQLYNEDLQVSNRNSNDFASPSGREDSELIIVLHCQTGKRSLPDSGPQPFWDPTSYTIQTLGAKGFDTAFSFGYDWHWVREVSCANRGPCPATQWPEDLRTLHDHISSLLFALLPARFALVGGLCVRRKVKEALKLLPTVRARTIYVPLSSLNETRLEFDLVFKDHELKRIIFYCPHPSAGYFEDPNGLRLHTLLFEAGSNFLLWLLGKPCNPTIFHFQKDATPFSYRNQAPLTEVRHYIALEEKIKRKLDLSEYAPKFILWAKSFLGDIFDETTRNRGSIAKVCGKTLDAKAWLGRIKKYRQRHDAGQALRPTSSELSSSDIQHWKTEINRDLARRRKKKQVKRVTKASQQGFSKDNIPRLANAARRQGLLNGTKIRCSSAGATGKHGRVILRLSLYVYLPKDVDFNSVWIWCDLREKGTKHPECCAVKTQVSDPATRLGILVRYSLIAVRETKEFWYKFPTGKHMEKVNSLVGYLDGEN